jgi:Predicted Zn-dependent peptidases
MDIYAKFKKHVFPNGLELYSYQTPDVDDVDFEDIGFIVYAGHRQDPDGKEGLAHFIEHLAGDNCVMQKMEIQDFFLRNGGDYKLGSTDLLKTTYEFSLLADEEPLCQAFSIFSTILTSSNLKEREKERRRVFNEIIRAYGSEKENEIFEESFKAVWGGHPYFGKAIRSLGTEKTFSAITDIDLKNFYDQYYVPANMAIVAYGAMTEEKLVEIISQTDFIAAKPGDRNPAPSQIFIPKILKNNLFFGRGTKDGNDRAWDYVSASALPGWINSPAISIFSRSLDVVLKKRVQNSELGLYRANSLWRNYSDVYDFFVIVDAVPREKADEILRSVNESFLEVTADCQLFEKVKGWCIASFKFNDRNGRGFVNKVIGDLGLFQTIKTTTQTLKDIEKVSFADIQEVGKWLTPERRWAAFSQQ